MNIVYDILLLSRGQHCSGLKRWAILYHIYTCIYAHSPDDRTAAPWRSWAHL